MRGVAGLLLAAGAGSRLGLPKALVELGGQSLVEQGVQTLRSGGCAPVLVVVGAEAPRVREILATRDVVIVDNPAWRSGMGSSLRAGLEACAGQAQAAVVALVDQPGARPAVVRRLLAAWQGGARAATATYAGRRGHPVLFDAGLWPQLTAGARGDVGARDFLREHADLVIPVECDDVGQPGDIDTPEDLATWRERWS